MPIASQKESDLLSRLPEVRGRYRANAPLADMSWFRVGGPADVLFKPVDEEDLQLFLKETPRDIPVTVLGVASNCIIRDGGISGVVVRLGRGFAQIEQSEQNPNQIIVGAAALDANVAKQSQKLGLSGLEFYSGIPGTIGGALRMNAGCYDTETKDVLISATAIDRSGQKHMVTADDLKMTYRHTEAPDDWIFTSAILQGQPDDPAEIQKRIDDIQTRREGSQPIRERTGGSTFANPDGHKAWQLIDQVGGRGFKVGGAQMSEKHCNFMINTGDATASDLETLGETMRKRVKEETGVELRWEIKRIGEVQ